MGLPSPDEIRKNVECPQCKRLVILTFEIKTDKIEVANQEVIEPKAFK